MSRKFVTLTCSSNNMAHRRPEQSVGWGVATLFGEYHTFEQVRVSHKFDIWILGVFHDKYVHPILDMFIQIFIIMHWGTPIFQETTIMIMKMPFFENQKVYHFGCDCCCHQKYPPFSNHSLRLKFFVFYIRPSLVKTR